MRNNWDGFTIDRILSWLEYYTINMHSRTWRDHDLRELNNFVLNLVVEIEDEKDQEAAFELLCEAVEKSEGYDDDYGLPY